MQLQHILPAALFAASTLAAKFNGFSDIACQQYDGTYIPMKATQLQEIVVKDWAATQEYPEASRSFTAPDDKKNCPSNSDDTYKWVSLTIFVFPSPLALTPKLCIACCRT
jgi:hypothetical protein